MKALEKDRSRRYETASSLAADIQRYLSDEPVLACPPTTMYRFQKFARKHKPALLTAAAIALCLLLGTTVSAWQAIRATAAESQAAANEVQANASAQKADEKAKEASTQRDEAQKQRDEVKALADKLAAKEQQIQRTLYAAHINLANNAWDAGGIRRVNDLLEQHRPKPGETDLRGFEWHYLYKLCHPELLTLKRNGGGVAFSPDGKRLALGDKTWDETKKAFGAAEVKVCDAQTGRELLRFKGRAGSIAFSPDGKRLVGEGGVVELKVWDAQTGQELLNLRGHTCGIECVAYSPDGKRLASGSNVWQLQPGKLDPKVPSELKIWDAVTGQELVATKSHADTVNCMAFSPDGQRLASGSYDGTVKVWSVHSGEELLTFKAQVASVAFSPDGKRLVSGGYQGVKVWDAQTGQELLTVKGATSPGQINGVAYSPDGKRLASVGGPFGVVRVWDAQTGDEIYRFQGHTGSGSHVAFNPEGTRLASAGIDGTARIWDVSTRQQAPAFGGATGLLRSVCVSPDGKRLAATWRDSMAGNWRTVPAVKVWDAHTGRQLLSFNAEPGETFVRVIFSPDGTRLAAGSGAWDDKKDEYIASGQVKVWDAETGREILTFKGHTAPVVDVVFSPDSTRVVSTSSRPSGSDNSDPLYPGEVKIWDAKSGEELLTLKGQKRFVDGVAYSPDGKRLATLSRDNTLKVWDAQTGQELLSLPVQISIGGRLAFSPDGKRLVSSNNSPNTTSPLLAGEVKVWNAQSGQELFTLQGHAGAVTSLVFSPDGKRLASGSGGIGPGGGGGRGVKLWDAETGEELLTFAMMGGGGVVFSPDGHRLVSTGTEGLKIFDATPQPNP